MEYEGMSDFEVNKLIAYALDWNDGEDGYFDELPQLVADFCNSPSDAWPIIVENKIDLLFGLQHITAKAFKGSVQSATDKNPLRAAMICFLKMKDAENE